MSRRYIKSRFGTTLELVNVPDRRYGGVTRRYVNARDAAAYRRAVPAAERGNIYIKEWRKLAKEKEEEEREVNEEEEREEKEEKGREENEEEESSEEFFKSEKERVRNEMMEKFDKWGADKKQIQRKLEVALRKGDIRYEGDGMWQISNTDTPLLKAGSVKLRYHDETKGLQIYLRGYVYKEKPSIVIT